MTIADASYSDTLNGLRSEVATVLASEAGRHLDLSGFYRGPFYYSVEDHHASRVEMLEEESLWRFARATAWLEVAERTKHPNPRVYSYGLKHLLENAFAGPNGYLSNGECICAALHLGIPVKCEPGGGPNAYIGITVRWIDWLKSHAIR